MSRTWKRRSRHRGKPLASIKTLRKADQAYEAEVRACCLTNRTGPHALDCQRDSGKCRTKVAFTNRDKAVLRAAELSAKDGSLMTAYRCPACAQWHIGHPKEGEAGRD